MKDQASKLREKAEKIERASFARVITVTSGKGGVGKTHLTANLGISLANKGKSVLLLDADIGMANIDVLMGIVPEYSLYDVFEGSKTLDEILIPCPSGVNLIPGGVGFSQLAYLSKMEKKHVEEGLGQIVYEHDFILIDTGAGLSRNVLAFIAASNEVIVVVTPEPTSITDAYSLIKAISRFKLNNNIHLVINMVMGGEEAAETADKIINVVKLFLGTNINILGYIQTDNAVVKAVKKQTPFLLMYPNSTASRQIVDIAGNLIMNKGLDRFAKDGFVKKLLRFFA